MSSINAWESDKEKEQKNKDIEKVKNDPDYYRWRELHEKYRELEEYFRLKEKWSYWIRSHAMPEEVEVTQQMIDDFVKETGAHSYQLEQYSYGICKRALVIFNGDFNKAIKYLLENYN